jgi:hypothetical protein
MPLPPPITTGTTIQTYTDQNGDVWVAKNGVNAGAWKRARDVLHGRVYRTAAWNVPTAWTSMPFDTTSRDPYTMWVPANNGYTVPLGGIYRVTLLCSVVPTATAQAVAIQVQQNGQGQLESSAHASTIWGIDALSTGALMCVAGDVVSSQIISTPSLPLSLGTPVVGQNYFMIDYLGTG